MAAAPPVVVVVVVAPAAPASANVAKLLTEPVALCAVMGAQAVAELSMAMSYKKGKEKCVRDCQIIIEP